MSPADPPGGPAAAASTRSVFLRVFPSVMLPMFLAVIDQTIVAAALPAIAAELGQVERVSWIVVAYLVANTIAAPVYGRLGDVFGRRLLMFIALAVFSVACVLCALAPSVTWLIAFRVLQGLGGGGLMTTSQALIGEAIPPRDRARYQGYLAGVVVTASMLGPAVGGLLTAQFGWRSIFVANLPLVAVAAVLATRLPRFEAKRDESFRFDGLGLALLTVVVVTTLAGLGQINRVGTVPAWLVAACFALWAAGVVLFVRRERRFPSPLVPLTLLARPAIWRADALAACHGAALVSLVTYLPIYFSVVRGASPTEVGLLLLPLTTTVGLGAMVTGRLVASRGMTAALPTTGLSVVVVLLATLAFAAPVLSTPGLVTLLALIALFMGTVMPVVQVTVQSAAGRDNLGAASASVQFSRSIGAAVGTATVGVVLFGVLAAADPKAAGLFTAIVEKGAAVALAGVPASDVAVLRREIADAFRAAFLAIAAFSATGVVLAATNPFRRLA